MALLAVQLTPPCSRCAPPRCRDARRTPPAWREIRSGPAALGRVVQACGALRGVHACRYCLCDVLVICACRLCRGCVTMRDRESGRGCERGPRRAHGARPERACRPRGVANRAARPLRPGGRRAAVRGELSRAAPGTGPCAWSALSFAHAFLSQSRTHSSQSTLKYHSNIKKNLHAVLRVGIRPTYCVQGGPRNR